MAVTVNLQMDQGSDFVYLFQISANGVSLANATPHAAMMTEYDNANSIVSFQSSLIGSNVTISMPAQTTANLTPGFWVYDVLVKDGTSNTVTRCVQGTVKVHAQVTPTP